METNNSRIYDNEINELGNGIAIIRKEKHLTQTQLAERAGIRQPTLSSIELRKKGINSDTLFDIAAALGVKIQDIADAAENVPESVRDLKSFASTLTESEAKKALEILKLTFTD